MRIAIDTNCLIAALTNADGSCGKLVREAELVLGGGWLARMVGREMVRELLRHLRTRSAWVEKPARITDLHLKDEGDLRMVETAVAGGTRYVVTTDRSFLSRRGYADVEFVTPGELLGIL